MMRRKQNFVTRGLGGLMAAAIATAGSMTALERVKADDKSSKETVAAAGAGASAGESAGGKEDSKEDGEKFDLGAFKKPAILSQVRELGITKEQTKQIGVLGLEYILKVLPQLKELKGKPKEAATAKAKEIVDGFEEKVKGVLTPEQINKLDKLKAEAAEKAKKAAAGALEKASKAADAAKKAAEAAREKAEKS